jgi:hypothetical protein
MVGPGVELPAWFNEGNARFEDLTVPGTEWVANMHHYSAASAAALLPSPLIPLGDLRSQLDWNARTGTKVDLEYFEGLEAARFLRQDVGIAGTVRIVDLISQGQTFDAAFASVSGKAFDSFAAAFASRLKASVTTYPGLAVANDSYAGAGVSYVVYGFGPMTPLQVAIERPGWSTSASSRVTDAFGVITGYIAVASGWAPGTYTITVTDQVRSVSSTLVLP